MRAIILSLFLIPFFLFAAEVKSYDFVVAKDGTGNLTTIQDAIHAVPDFRKKETYIYFKNGTYTSGSASFYCYGDDFTAINLSFKNESGPVGQAVAAWISGDRNLFLNCRFLGFQDTLYTFGQETRQLYYQCYIVGTVDFIFGASTAWFENCEQHGKNKGYITAASTPEQVEFGYIFNNCNITGNKDTKTCYLGRLWRPNAKVIFMHCNLPQFIEEKGWRNWGKESNEKATYFAEYKNKGAGSMSQNRVKWSHGLKDSGADSLNFKRVFKDWAPNFTFDR